MHAVIALKSQIQETSISWVKDLFKYLSVETKDFKYQISLELLLSKYKRNGEREFAHVSFNSTTKTVIGSKDSIDKSFEEIFNEIDKRISEESGWVNESDDSE